MLHLSDAELSIIMDACKPLAPKDRDSFVRSVHAVLV